MNNYFNQNYKTSVQKDVIQQQQFIPGRPGSPSSPGGPGRPGGPSRPGGPGGPGRPGGPGGPGQRGPSNPPPNFTPQMPSVGGGQERLGTDQRGAAIIIGPGGGDIRRCLNRFTYVWLINGNNFWFYPINVRGQFVEGFRWRRNRWEFDTILRRRILFSSCF